LKFCGRESLAGCSLLHSSSVFGIHHLSNAALCLSFWSFEPLSKSQDASTLPFSSKVSAISETLVFVSSVGSFHANDWSLNCGFELPGQLAPEQAAYV